MQTSFRYAIETKTNGEWHLSGADSGANLCNEGDSLFGHITHSPSTTLGAGCDKPLIDIVTTNLLFLLFNICATYAQNKDSLFRLDTWFAAHSLDRDSRCRHSLDRYVTITTTTCRFSSGF